MIRTRKSAKQEIFALTAHLMKVRPLNQDRVVIELLTIATICNLMGWESMRENILGFLGNEIEANAFNSGHTRGLKNAGDDQDQLL